MCVDYVISDSELSRDAADALLWWFAIKASRTTA